MKKELNIGDEVFIFDSIYDNPNYQFDMKKPLEKGTVIEKSLSGDLSYHGSPWYVNVYDVLGDNGKKYVGTYNHCYAGSVSLLTVEDYVDYLDYQVDLNIEKEREIREQSKRIMDYKKQIEKEYLKPKVKSKGSK